MFFYNAVVGSLEHRKNSKERRNDLVDLMLDAVSNKDVEEAVDQEQFDLDSMLQNHKRDGREIGEIEGEWCARGEGEWY